MWVISPRKTHVFMIAKYQFYRFSQHFKRKKCDPLFNWLIETNNSVKIPFSNSYHYWISQWSLRQNSTLSPASVSSEVFLNLSSINIRIVYLFRSVILFIIRPKFDGRLAEVDVNIRVDPVKNFFINHQPKCVFFLRLCWRAGNLAVLYSWQSSLVLLPAWQHTSHLHFNH